MSHPSYRALLVGVPSYRDTAVSDLPFVENDLRELAQALDGVGYEVEVHDVSQTGRDEIESAIEIFFQEAAPGQTLLLFLSGHGIHHRDTDYLVPRGALTRVHDFPGKCVPIDFGAYAERSAAGDVVVFVDACREGIDLREKALGNVLGWSEIKVRRVGDRHHCHVYACSKGEYARYATAGQVTFSLFSRALSTLVADESGPSTLGEVQERLQTTLDQLTSEHECRRQQVRVRTESDIDDFVVFARPERAAPLEPGETSWARLAREHPAWQQVEHAPGAEVLRDAVEELADRLHRTAEADRRLLSGDPWSPAGLAERMTERVTWLLSKVLNPQKLELSPAEAARLVTAPFLYTAHRYRTAVGALSAEPTRLSRTPGASALRADYEQYFSAYARLVRRAGRSDAEGAEGIAWWLFHHWLTRHPEKGGDEALAALLAPVAPGATGADARLVSEVFDLDDMTALVRALQSTPDFTADRPARQLAGMSGFEQRVRRQLVFALLAVAHRSAMDPRTLGDIVVDHLGISYAVSLPELQETLEKARWEPRGRTRVLHAVCGHPAVGLALQQQATVLDGVLAAVDVRAGSDPQLAPLEDLPAHATADQVVPALNSRGKRVYESTDLRFRLADDRIQELLMGEELYGDPALAIRELYQNALDACRYRDARTAYLRRTAAHGFTGEWEGRIDFVQGEKDGRPYIQCTDNGIGMGERELREVFSHAGMRFADLPEYIDELAAWQAEGIELHPNSRFGIGVLSYFMLADDLQVTTCRLDREGHPGNRLRVDIAGPGALFRIQDLGRGHEAGTTVRLWLRDPDTAVSAKEVLRRLLWISDYRVTAGDTGAGPDEEPLVWSPGALSDVAPLGDRQVTAGRAVRDPEAVVSATDRAEVWWCSTTGAVLSDGLWAGTPLWGAVVDLKGRHAPQLTVDRKRCITWDQPHVRRLLHAEIPALIRSDATILTASWLSDVAVHHGHELADAVMDAAARGSFTPWGVHGHEGPVDVIGCFPEDAHVFTKDRSVPWGPVPSDREGPETEWRTRAWAAAGAYPGVRLAPGTTVPLAHPLDNSLLSGVLFPEREGHTNGGASRLVPGHGLSFIRTVLRAVKAHGLPPGTVWQRLVELGHPPPAWLRLPEDAGPEDLELFDQERLFLPDRPLQPTHVMHLARILRQSTDQVVQRLAGYGYTVPDWFRAPRRITQAHTATALVSDREAVVSVAQVAKVAAELGRSREDVAHAYEEIGRAVLPSAVPLTDVTADDVFLLSSDADSNAPWLSSSDTVPVGHLLLAAARLRLPVEAVAARLTELGHDVPDLSALPREGATSLEMALLSRHGDGKSPWLTPRGRLGPTQAVVAAAWAHCTPSEAISVWEEWGLVAPGSIRVPDTAHREDVLLVSKDLDGDDPRLDDRKPLALGHVLQAAVLTGREPAEIASRLAAFGHHLPAATPLPARTLPNDVEVLRTEDEAGWLTADRPVGLAHILAAAAETGRLPAAVAARLGELGYTLPPGVEFTEE
ncbi:wHTH domain-containing protein [Streptomyces zhihengii]